MDILEKFKTILLNIDEINIYKDCGILSCSFTTDNWNPTKIPTSLILIVNKKYYFNDKKVHLIKLNNPFIFDKFNFNKTKCGYSCHITSAYIYTNTDGIIDTYEIDKNEDIDRIKRFNSSLFK